MSTLRDILSKKIDEYIAAPTEENLNNIKSFVKENGADVNGLDYNDETPLFKVVKKQASYESTFTPNKKLELMQTLIDLGADVNKQDRYGMTPLMHTTGAYEETKLLLDNNANIYLADKNGNSVLNYLKPDQKKLVMYKDAINAVSSGKCNANIKIYNDNTSLLMEYGDIDAKSFIKAGTDLNAQNDFGETALMVMKNKESIKDVIEAGANLDIKDRNGNTALARAVMSNAGLEKATLLTAAGADITAKNNKGESVLMLANSKEEIDLILETAKAKGMDIQAMLNEKDNEGKTVLAHAFENNRSNEVIQTLLDHGANLYEHDNKGNITYSHANQSAQKLIIPILVDNRIKDIAREQDPEKRSIAATNLLPNVTNKEQAKSLLDLGGKINATDNQGHTVLMHAVYKNNIEAVKILTEVGADTKIKDNFNKNAMDYAQTPEMKSTLTMASVKQHTMANAPQTQTQETPAKQPQVNMAVRANSQGGR